MILRSDPRGLGSDELPGRRRPYPGGGMRLVQEPPMVSFGESSSGRRRGSSVLVFGRWRLRRFGREMAGVLEATRALAEVDDLADGLALLARQLTELFDGTACMISRYDAERDVTTDWAGYARPPFG